MAALAWVAAGLAVPALVVEVLEAVAWELESEVEVRAWAVEASVVQALARALGAAGSAWAAVVWVVEALVAPAWGALAWVVVASAVGASAG